MGILISSKLGVTVHDEFRDIDGNILMLNITVQGKQMTLGSVYGPNNDDENFFVTISDTCRRYRNDSIILGGDWNTTFDGNPVRINIDTLNMADIPSKRRSKWLKNLCDNNELTYPYRHFYPDRLEFTYIPNANAQTNRSRLDFYLVSKNLLLACKNCTIAHHLDIAIFDHKSVRLDFRRNKPSNKQVIKDTILKDVDLPYRVKCQVIEHYLQHALICDEFPLGLQQDLLQTIGQITHKSERIKEILLDIAMGSNVENVDNMLANLRGEIMQH